MRLKLWKRPLNRRSQIRNRALCLWHLWFAWYPVRVQRNDWRWLEKVNRKGIQVTATYDHIGGESTHWEWSYKPANLEKTNAR